MLSRKKAPWPKNEGGGRPVAPAAHGGGACRDAAPRNDRPLAKEQGKENPGSDDRSPKEKIALRYERFLRTVTDVDEEDIANYFLSAVARAYDPHTDYMSFREMNRFKAGMKNELVGIGALLQAEEDGATKIMGIVVGGPAERRANSSSMTASWRGCPQQRQAGGHDRHHVHADRQGGRFDPRQGRHLGRAQGGTGGRPAR